MPDNFLPRHAPYALLATFLTLAAGCGGGGGSGEGGTAACSEVARKSFVLAASREWYLFPDLLPATVDTAGFATAEDLLDHLTATARAQGKDRYFSYLTTRAEENSLLGEGQFIGFGFRTRTDPGPRTFVVEVFETSPAEEAEIVRGDEIVAVDSGSGFVPVTELLADGSSISDVLGPPDAGVQRGLRLLRDGATRDVSLVKRTVTIDPVSDLYGAKVFPVPGTIGVGYVNLRSYISTADAQLRNAFAQFPDGITDFIVDLRYNGGGLVSIAELLNNLLGGARSTSDVQLRLLHNPSKSAAEDVTVRFDPRPESLQPIRIAFLTTGGTASASELNVNSMKPWVEVAIVGEDTYGKPVGQLAFDLRGCEDRLRLVSFRSVNALGEGDYYGGLAETLPFACAAPDTLPNPLGDPAEGMVAAALDWLKYGVCGSPIATAPAAREKPGGGRGPDRFPRPRHPSAAQFWLPGVD